jgi:hypothetical protein
MSARWTFKQVNKVLRLRRVVLVEREEPHFLFDAAQTLPEFEEHQLCATFYEGHLADLKLAEWSREEEATSLPSAIDLDGMQLEPQS